MYLRSVLWVVPEDQCPSPIFGSVLESDGAPHGHVTAGQVTEGGGHGTTGVTLWQETPGEGEGGGSGR